MSDTNHPLMLNKALDAIAAGDSEELYELLTNGLDVNSTTEDGESLLHLAIYSRNDAVIEEVMASGLVNLNKINFSYTTPLAVAVEHGNLPLIIKLLRAGANPAFQPVDEENVNLFMVAASIDMENSSNRIRIMQLFLDEHLAPDGFPTLEDCRSNKGLQFPEDVKEDARAWWKARLENEQLLLDAAEQFADSSADKAPKRLRR